MKPLLRGKRLSLMLAVIYFTSYVTRINFGAVVQEVATDTNYEKSTLSVILVSMSVAYGIGQIINGKIGDTIPPQNLILYGLILATAMNFALPFCSFSILLMAILWIVNGFAQAMIWPPMVKIMVDTMDELTYSKAVVTVTVGSSAGTVFVYLAAPLILNFASWKAVLLISAFIGLATIIMWGASSKHIYDGNVPRSIPNEGATEKTSHTSLVPKAAVLPLCFIVLAIVFQGMLRDSVTSWMPSYLAEVFGFSNQSGILCTVLLAIFSLVSIIAAGALYQNSFKNEIACAALLYGVTAAAAALLVLFFHAGAAIAILMLTVITGAVHGINLMLVTHVPKRFRKYGNVSTLSGIINAFTYIGASVATYGIAKLSEVFGWHMSTGVWLGIALLGLISCLIAMPKWKRFIKE